ncbi:MAG: hypothetical protein RMH74_03160 [Candidatus Caldarchaeum sp.]|nr:hypothetical protein [Candidatus Caldarchaeum sp.]
MDKFVAGTTRQRSSFEYFISILIGIRSGLSRCPSLVKDHLNSVVITEAWPYLKNGESIIR